MLKNLFKSQVRKLIQKVCKRESFQYRKLTDRPVDAEKVPKNENSKLNFEELAAGNKKYIPVLKSIACEHTENMADEKDENSAKSSLVTYQGALIDVGKLMEQLERNEKARLETDEKLKNLQREFEILNEAASLKEKQSQKLNLELEEQKQKLGATEEELRKVKQEAEKFHKALNTIKEGLQTSLNVADSSLQKTKIFRTSRNSPNNRREFDSENDIKNDKSKQASKIDKDLLKEANGFDNGSNEVRCSNKSKDQDTMDAE